MSTYHPLAYVHPDAKIGPGVVIEPFSYVAADVVVGEGTWVGPHAIIMDGARIGKNCKIFPGAVISAIPQDLKFKGETTTAEIGDNNTIRECATINRGTASRGKTIVGNNNLLMAYSHIAHDCVVGNNVIIGNGTQIAGEVEIDDFAILSANVLIHQFERIGCHVMIQGGCRLNQDIPPYIIAAHEPVVFAGINVIGLRRRGFSPEQLETIQTAYRMLYNQGMNTTQAVEAIEAKMPQTAERDAILNFIKTSERGIVRARATKEIA